MLPGRTQQVGLEPRDCPAVEELKRRDGAVPLQGGQQRGGAAGGAEGAAQPAQLLHTLRLGSRLAALRKVARLESLCAPTGHKALSPPVLASIMVTNG